MHRAAALALLVCTTAPLTAQGGRGYLFEEPRVSVTLYGGFAQPGAGGDLWAFTFDELTLGKRDLASLERGGDISVRVSPRVDLFLSYAVADARSRSEMREWVDEDGSPIRQTTRFIRRPLGLNVRYHFRERGRSLGTYAWVPTRVLPYASLGFGRMSYRMDQAGQFVEGGTSEIFNDRYRAEGRSSFTQAGLGTALALSPSVVLTGEARYILARGDGDPSFTDFNRLDLSGLSTSLGLTFRLR